MDHSQFRLIRWQPSFTPAESSTPKPAWYYYRARYYGAGFGRFISRDPVGYRAVDFNLYRYVGDRPLGRMDSSGLMTDEQTANHGLYNLQGQLRNPPDGQVTPPASAPGQAVAGAAVVVGTTTDTVVGVGTTVSGVGATTVAGAEPQTWLRHKVVWRPPKRRVTSPRSPHALFSPRSSLGFRLHSTRPHWRTG